MGEELSAAGYAVEYAGSWDSLLSERLAPSSLAAVLLGEYGDAAAEEEVLRRFRARDGGVGVPVVVVGRQNAANRAGRFREAGADLVIAADLPPGEILERARPLLAYGELYQGVAAAVQELRDQSMVDGLTGLPNRRHFVLELARTVEMARRIGRPLSCIVSDIDDLQDVNDAHGRPAGDGVIRQFGEILTRAKRSYDGVARLGGDEFAWLLVDAGPEQAMQAARRAHRMVGEAVFDGADSPLRLTATFGVASLIPGEEWTAASLMENADRALYWGKESGKNAVRCYPPQKGAGDA
jgi:diguanylate cyclase (GGDEF)-like protein